jgi:hypothetical protein
MMMYPLSLSRAKEAANYFVAKFVAKLGNITDIACVLRLVF